MIKRYIPKPCVCKAVKRLGKRISTITRGLCEDDLASLRKLYLFAHNYNDEKSLRDMVCILNARQYHTGSSFQVLTTFTHEHGATLEIRETRF